MNKEIFEKVIKGVAILFALLLIGYGIYDISSTLLSEESIKKETTVAIKDFKQAVSTDTVEDKGVKDLSLIDEDVYAIGIMRIPSMNLEAPIANGATEKILKKYVGMYTEYDEIGVLGGNSVFASHSARRNNCAYCFFNHLEDNMSIGDEIEILFKDGNTYKYKVYEIKDYQDPYAEWFYERVEGREIVTLITCTDGDPEQRTIVRGQRVFQ